MKNFAMVMIAGFALILFTGGLVVYSFLSSESGTGASSDVADPFAEVIDPFGMSTVGQPSQEKRQSSIQSRTSQSVYVAAKETLIREEGAESEYYLLYPKGYTSTSTPFRIIVSPESDFVQITINANPIGRYRKEAEKLLLEHFNLSESEACGLPYIVTPAYETESEYIDTDVGFSFCPGSVVLTEI